MHCFLFLYSSGRDRVLILWSISSGSSIRVLPVYEEIEDTFIVPVNVSLPISLHDKNDSGVYVAAAGEKGFITRLYYFLINNISNNRSTLNYF